MNPIIPIISLVLAGQFHFSTPLSLFPAPKATVLYLYKEKECDRHPDNPPKRHVPVVKLRCIITPDGAVFINDTEVKGILRYKVYDLAGTLIVNCDSREEFIKEFSRLKGDFMLHLIIADDPEDVTQRSEARQASPGRHETAARTLTALAAENSDGNLMFSPLCFDNVMAMTANAVTGKARQEILDFLRAGDLSALNRTETFLSHYIPSLGEKGVFDMTSEICTDPSVDILPQFSALIDSCYPRALHTPGCTRDGVGESAASVTLVSAMDFSAPLTYPFLPDDTYDGTFNTPHGPKAVRMMHGTRLARYANLGDAQVLSLLFGEGEYTLTFILPDSKTGIDGLISSITGEKLQHMTTSGFAFPIDISVPKFHIADNVDLTPVLDQLGCGSMTAPTLWQGLTDSPMPLHVGRIVHKNGFGIDEAPDEEIQTFSDGIPGSTMTPHTSFTADRPFLFVITENECGTPILIGRVSEP